VAGDGFLFEVGQAGDGKVAGVFGSCAFDAESEKPGSIWARRFGVAGRAARGAIARSDRAELTEEGRCVAGLDGRGWEEGSDLIAQ
jgi:hypothetical protein